jgi:ribosome-associated heat shock protein Hsp15
MGVRIDKWLWSVRLYKTRSISTDACKSGRITIDGKTVKASKEINIGDIIDIKKDNIQYKLKVLQLSEKRMGAALIDGFREDLTPASEYDKMRQIKSGGFEYRDKGLGRPSKKDRRNLNSFKKI